MVGARGVQSVTAIDPMSHDAASLHQTSQHDSAEKEGRWYSVTFQPLDPMPYTVDITVISSTTTAERMGVVVSPLPDWQLRYLANSCGVRFAFGLPVWGLSLLHTT
mmetsp:Transcript_51853/g.59552  ORF Transcript_51853/g.59552 Transcript_51853/m.59552 type:complete len:106 (-) Transcript_51853:210-527(-)